MAILKVKDSRGWHNIPALVGPRGEQGIRGEKGDTGEKGEKGNVMFASFAINPLTGILTMRTDAEYTGANFSINNGYLEVTI